MILLIPKMVFKKGTILVENVIFIVLNVLFLSILILYLTKQGSSAYLLEQTYSKQIALLLDSSESGMEILLNMNDVKEISDENGIDFSKIVFIKDNFVNVKLSEEGGYQYSLFRNLNVEIFPQVNELNEYTGVYVFRIL